MFKFFKNLLAGKPADEKVADKHWRPIIAPPPAQHHVPTVPLKPTPRYQPIPRSPAGRNGNGNAAASASADSTAKVIQLSLASVLNGLPLELKGRVKQVELGEIVFSIPLDKVLAQLSLGSVKITFGELRRAAPKFFSTQNDLDQTPVSLPLNEILAQLSPALLFRRQNQKQIEVPEEIRSPFSENGQGLVLSVGPGKAPAPQPAAVRAMTSAPSPAPQAPSLPPNSTSFTRRPSVSPPVEMPKIAFRSNVNSTPPPPAPAPAPAETSGVAASASRVLPESPSQAPVEISNLQPVRAAVAAGEAPAIGVPLSLVMESWPESLKLEIAQLGLVDARLALPLDVLKNLLQRGRIHFTWKALRTSIKSAGASAVSAHDNTSLELPLKVIAPLFMAREKDLASSKQKVAIDETIPDLFFGFPQPEAAAQEPPAPAPCAVTKPVDTNFYSDLDASNATEQCSVPATGPNGTEIIAPSAKPAKPAGTDFLSRSATPNEIVSRAAALNGVAGSLIALPDGLMVASKLAADLNGDTIAAFVPQIFGKVNQCTKELRMGELNNLSFTVGNVPWKIFRVNAIFFAAFGHTSHPLPTAELAALAGELDRKKQ